MPKQGVSQNKPAGGNQNVGQGHPATGPKIGGNQAVPTAPSAAQVYNPGVLNPTPTPFLTQQELEEYAEAREQYQEGLQELDRNYETTKHSNEYEEAEIEKGRIKSIDTENWDAAARGLFQSSIRDADLADIDATAEIKKKFLSDQLHAIAVYNEGQKAKMETQWHRYEEATNRKKVENAEGVSSTMPKYAVEPSYSPAPAGPKQQASSQKPQAAKQRASTPKVGQAQKAGSGQSNNGGTSAPRSAGPQQQAKAFATKSIAGQIYGK